MGLATDEKYAGFAPVPPVEPTPRWVRVRLGGRTIADSRNALLHIQYGPGQLPTYYFPPADVDMQALLPAPAPDRGEGKAYRSVRVGEHISNAGAWIYEEPPGELIALKGHISFVWDAMDAWYEEEEEIFVHARDPYKRVDVISSSRHIRVEADGVVVAESERPYLLFETSLPTRYYLPRQDVRMDLLEPTSLQTRCPYKGVASYWSVRGGEKQLENVVWSYPHPIPENPKIKELMCFFNERVDIFEDGVLLPQPRTPWS